MEMGIPHLPAPSVFRAGKLGVSSRKPAGEQVRFMEYVIAQVTKLC